MSDNQKVSYAELLAFYRSYSRVVNQCFNSNFDHGFITHNAIECGSCGLTLNTKRRMEKIRVQLTKGVERS